MTTTEHVHDWSDWQPRTVTESRDYPYFRQSTYQAERRVCGECGAAEMVRSDARNAV